MTGSDVRNRLTFEQHQLQVRLAAVEEEEEELQATVDAIDNVLAYLSRQLTPPQFMAGTFPNTPKHRSEAEQKITDSLLVDGAVSLASLRSATGLSRDAVGSTLRRMLRVRTVERVSKGVYRLTRVPAGTP